MTPAVLFVCLGNICRSPLAEAAFRAAAHTAGLAAHADSAGTGDWHIGAPPDHRAIAEAARHGIDITGLRARQITPADFHRFTHICALDRDNLAGLRRIAPADTKVQPRLLMDWLPGRAGQSVADPYYGTASDFAAVWDEVTDAAAALVRAMQEQAL